MGTDRQDGVVVSSGNISSLVVYFVQTHLGAAIAFPRVHSNAIQIGGYVNVCLVPYRGRNRSRDVSYEVDSMTFNERPNDHRVKNGVTDIHISCEAVLVGTTPGFFIFENSYLGRMVRCHTDSRAVGMKIGTVCRVECRRSTSAEKRQLINVGIHWVIDSIHSSPVSSSTNVSTADLNDGDWTAIVISGRSGEVWHGTGSGLDTVKIPMGNAHSIVMGSVHRVKYFTDADTGMTTAYEFDPSPIVTTDYQLAMESSSTDFKIWCTSRIIAKEETYWTVYNDMMGLAKLPFDVTKSSMNIGYELRTMYKRETAKSADGILWNVVKAIVLREETEEAQPPHSSHSSHSNELTDVTTTTSDTNSTTSSETIASLERLEAVAPFERAEIVAAVERSETVASFERPETVAAVERPETVATREKRRERSTLDLMRHFMSYSNVRVAFETFNRSALHKIDPIIAKDTQINP